MLKRHYLMNELDREIEEGDKKIEKLWDELEDVPFDEDRDGRLILGDDWHGFKKGTDRDDIWLWFDEQHSKGVRYLLCEREAEYVEMKHPSISELHEILDARKAWLDTNGAEGERANLSNMNLTGRWLGNAVLNGADLTNAHLRGVNLKNASLKGANLEGANLGKANLVEVDLEDACLRNAVLNGADLTNTNLRGANLQDANLKGANLTGSNFYTADFGHNDAIYKEAQKKLLQELSDMGILGREDYERYASAKKRNGEEVPEIDFDRGKGGR